MFRLARFFHALVSGLRRWVAPIDPDGTVKARTGNLISTLLLIAAGLWASSVTLMALLHTGNRPNIILALVGSALLLGVRELVRRGRVTLATILGIATVWGVITAFHYNLGTPYSVHLLGYLMLVIIAAWLSGWGGGLAAVLLSVAAIYALGRAESAGLLPPAVRMQPLNLALNMAGYLGAAFGLFWLARSNSLAALGEAQAEIARRQEAEAALCDLNAILEQQVAERTAVLRESEQRYRDLYENAPVAHFSVGPDGRIRRCNRQASRLLGYTVEQLVDRPVFDLYADTPNGKPKARQVFQRFLAAEPVAGEELQMAKADGTPVWISLSVAAILDDAGQVVESRSTTIDISARKQAAEALRASEERYRTLLALSPDGISVVDSTGRILFCNEQFAFVCGLTKAEEAEGRYAAEFSTPAGFERLFGDAAAVLQAGHDVARNIEVQLRARDGAVIELEYSIARVPWATAPDGHAFLCVGRDLTRRKRMQAELERYRDNLEALVQARTAELERVAGSLTAAQRIAHMGSWELDPATNDLFVSDELRLIYGFALEAQPLTLADVDDRIHPDDRTAAVVVRQRALQELHAGQGYSNQYRIVLPGGETRVVHVIGDIVRDATGQLRQVFGMAQDITEQEQARAALSQRVEELTRLQELSHPVSLDLPLEEVAGIYLDRIIDYAEVDLAHVSLLQDRELRVTAIRTSPRLPLVQVPTLAVGQCLCGLAARNLEPQFVEEVEGDARFTQDNCRANGLHSVAALPLMIGDAAIGVLTLGAAAPRVFAGRNEFLAVAADLVASRLHKAILHGEIQQRADGLEESVAERTRELQAERDRTHAILETVGESVVVTDLEGQVLFANPATSVLTGFSRDELLGQLVWHNWTAQTLAGGWADVERALASGQTWQGEIYGRRKDGALYIARVSGSPLHDASTPRLPVGAVWVQRDITDLKNAERLKDQFVSNVSHELRTPISIIGLSCDNLAAYGPRLDEDQRRQIFKDIHDQAHLLGDLVDNILMLSRIDSGRVPVEHTRVDLTRLVVEEVDRQQAVAQRRSQKLEVVAPHPIGVEGDPVQLRQVIRNLLDNAIKYTQPGGQIHCTCETRAAEPAGGDNAAGAAPRSWAVIEIADNGIGIAAEAVPVIFERFNRGQVEGDVPGTGLGLPIAGELTQIHGGWIDVASAPGMGSTFTVHLPWQGDVRTYGECVDVG